MGYADTPSNILDDKITETPEQKKKRKKIYDGVLY